MHLGYRRRSGGILALGNGISHVAPRALRDWAHARRYLAPKAKSNVFSKTYLAYRVESTISESDCGSFSGPFPRSPSKLSAVQPVRKPALSGAEVISRGTCLDAVPVRARSFPPPEKRLRSG